MQEKNVFFRMILRDILLDYQMKVSHNILIDLRIHYGIMKKMFMSSFKQKLLYSISYQQIADFTMNIGISKYNIHLHSLFLKKNN